MSDSPAQPSSPPHPQIDNLANSSLLCLPRIHALTGRPSSVTFVQLDIRDKAGLTSLFAGTRFDAVVHFAGYKAVGESRTSPDLYYENNVLGSLTLFEAMRVAKVQTLVFSSSCTVYGEAESPLSESSPTGVGITNAYARSKFILEEALKDLAAADPNWRVCLLRYFNPVGALWGS